ncbi:hypothetical protein AAF712_009836 [Marasmius tenuissimus]|uniref:Cytochrome P450 n=1 Tax=Marasmius tenuissimus TaxID=585030 RepID=A0ABR2ZQU0_9AGAR
MPQNFLLVSSALVAILVSLGLKNFNDRRRRNYPPGPPPSGFITGNMKDIPDKKPWVTYNKWAKEYGLVYLYSRVVGKTLTVVVIIITGDIVHLEALGDHLILLNNLEAANELLEKRSRIYSSRPYAEAGKITGWSFHPGKCLFFSLALNSHSSLDPGLIPYSDEWRQSRRTHQQIFRRLAVEEMLRPSITLCANALVERLFEQPEKFQDHLYVYVRSARHRPNPGLNHKRNYTRYSASPVLRIMYGIVVTSTDDPLLRIAVKAIHTLDEAMHPKFVTMLAWCPFIPNIPKWVPFFGPMRAFIEQTRGYIDALRNEPLKHAEEDVVGGHKLLQLAGAHNSARKKAGRENDSIVANVLRRGIAQGGRSADEVERIKNVASGSFVVTTFFLAMTRNPNSQAKAQKEIDEVVGRDRLPTYEDRKSLPYIEAIYREVMRWHPPGPLGGAHMNTEDDVYKDYYIPKGSLVMGNIWAITRDERRYGPDTDAFKPERFFGADGKLNDDNLIVAFGFGRRVCAGRHLADAVVWLTIATVLACFKINKPKDPETGKEMDVPENYSDGPGVFR